MEFTKSDSGWVAATAALAGGVAYYFANRMHMRMTPANELVLERTTEVARMSPNRALAGAAAIAIGGLLVSRMARRRDSAHASGESSVEEWTEVNVPLSTAYNQWTQFEEFPRFMASVEEVRQLDDTHLHWRANVAGKTKEWDAEITEQVPDRKIAWRSTGGVRNSGDVTFERVSDNRTRIVLHMNYEPETVGEKVGSAVGGVKLTAKGNLKRFKELVERRGVETGAWRGSVAQH